MFNIFLMGLFLESYQLLLQATDVLLLPSTALALVFSNSSKFINFLATGSDNSVTDWATLDLRGFNLLINIIHDSFEAAKL